MDDGLFQVIELVASAGTSGAWLLCIYILFKLYERQYQLIMTHIETLKWLMRECCGNSSKPGSDDNLQNDKGAR